MIAEKHMVLVWPYKHEDGLTDSFPWAVLPGEHLDAEMSTWAVLGVYETRAEQLAAFDAWRETRP